MGFPVKPAFRSFATMFLLVVVREGTVDSTGSSGTARLRRRHTARRDGSDGARPLGPRGVHCSSEVQADQHTVIGR
ncbi:hypothetical protein D9M68_367890 [compost metagenome]